jgi:hypothetical protein
MCTSIDLKRFIRLEKSHMAELFVSYTKPDRTWAEWIAYTLEAIGYACIIQAWDFRPGANFVVEMQEGLKQAERMIAVLSPAYLQATFPAPEWAAAFADDPQGLQRKLVPVRVASCNPKGLLKSVVYIDLVGLDETKSLEALLDGVKPGRAKPTKAPAFPGSQQVPKFPGTRDTTASRPPRAWA